MNTSRRTFLKGLLGGGVSVLLGRHLPKPQVKEEIVEEAVGELLQVQGWLTHVNLPPQMPSLWKELAHVQGVRIEELPESVVMVK